MALENSGCTDVIQLFLKDLCLETLELPFESRQIYLEDKYRFSDEIFHKLVVGEHNGQILLNFDQCEVETVKADNDGKIDQNIEQGAKQWTSLYDPDYRLLFNKYVLPEEIFTGKKLGEKMIVSYGLFDPDIQTENIVLTNSAHNSKPNSGHPSHRDMTGMDLNMDNDTGRNSRMITGKLSKSGAQSALQSRV